MRSALLLPVLLVGLCSRRGDGTSTTAVVPAGSSVGSTSLTKDSTTVKPTTLATTSARPTNSPKPTPLSTVSITVQVPPTSAKTPVGTSSKASVETSSETPKQSPATTVRTSAMPPPTTKPSSSSSSSSSAAAAAAAHGTTQAGSTVPGPVIATSPSLSSKATATNSLVISTTHGSKATTTPEGSITTSAEQLRNPTSKAPTEQTTKSHLVTDVLVTTTAKALGSHSTATAVSPSATPHASSTGTRVTTRAASTSSTHHVPPPAGDSNGTHPAKSEIICEEEAPDESREVILTLNESRTCENVKNSHLEENLLNSICQAVVPSFNWSRDQCIMRVASSTKDTKHLAIIGVTVRTNSAAKQLFDSLTTNKGELEKLGVSNITHSGRTEDVNMEDRFSMPLIITIVCMAASLLLVAAIYGCCHQRLSQRKDQQRLTEELQTMENGYHDNPTLEVMETSSEMQEKKVNLNGELGDSWIVPMDNLTREDLEEEEDTHL